MKIDHVHFYVDNAQKWCNWFVRILGFQSVGKGASNHTHIEVVKSGPIYFVLSSPLSHFSHVFKFLHLHPPGVVDVAFRVQDIKSVMARALQHGARVLQPIQQEQQAQGCLKWGKIAAWGSLNHTFIERSGTTSLLPLSCTSDANSVEFPLIVDDNAANLAHNLGLLENTGFAFTGIDHVVLNVPTGSLKCAVAWYKNTLGFRSKQTFDIQTDYSGLHSEVMIHASSGGVPLPINEPTSANSQIQEFLDINRGSGIQHIALQTTNLVQAITQLRQMKLPFIQVPHAYYTQLQDRYGFRLPETDWQKIEAHQILVDWQDDTFPGMLLQTFTQPIFEQPTFFFELIERQACLINGECLQTQGFGEGNFRALFKAIELEQMKRGSLQKMD